MTISPLIKRQAATSGTPDDLRVRQYDPTTIERLAQVQAFARLGFDWCWEQDEQFRFIHSSAPLHVGVPALPPDFIGKRPWELDGTEFVGIATEAFKELHRKQKPYRDVLIRRKGRHGRTLVMLAAAAPIFDDAGIFTGYRGTARDVTGLMREREALDTALVEADRECTAKSRFLASMSHEIRTPLNGVLGMIDLLVNSDLSSEQRRLAHIAGSAGESLLGIINDVLDFSKISEGKLTLDARPFDPRAVIADVLDLLSVHAREKVNLTLRADVSKNVPLALIGDPNRLRQILTNLVANAVRFTETGEIVVRIDCSNSHAQSPSEPVNIEIAVRDTGAGMSAGALARLFQPYTQVGGNASQQAGGTGLGLVIVKQLVDAMSGSIHVESTPGVGSCFLLCLPLRVAESLPPVQPLQRVRTNTKRARSGGLALVIEDNTVNQVVVRAMLSRLGIACEIAADGAAGLAAYRSGRFDLILMDCELPVIDGFDTTRAIRALEQARHTRRIPIIALTANALQGDRERALAAGMDDYLTKPFKTDQLEGIVARWIDPSTTGP